MRIPGLTLVHHPDPQRIGEVAPLAALGSGRRVALSRLEPSFSPPRGGELRPLADAHLSRQPIWLGRSEPPGSFLLDPAGSPTELWVDGERIGGTVERPWQTLEEGMTLRLADRLLVLLHWIDPTPDTDLADFGLVGESLAMVELRRDIVRAARLDNPVLLRGETGTGKELVAAAIHHAGARSAGPFVAVNMAAIPPSLAAAELFGAVKGSYTGAAQRRGFFRRAEGGTLLLDEIGEIPVEMQVLLLRALETRRIRPVGQDRPEPVDVRILAATDADLETLARAGDFKTPLIHRLSGFDLRLPPLRHRRDDVGRLLVHFLRQELEAVDRLHRLEPVGPDRRPWLPAALMERLVASDWPGNVRQLRNVARHLVARWAEDDEIAEGRSIETLLAEGREGAARGGDPEPSAPPTEQTTGRGAWHGRPSQVTPRELRRVLAEYGWRLAPAATALGISRTSLYALLERHGLRRASEIGGRELDEGLARHGGDIEALAAELEVSAAGLRQRLRSLGRG